MGVRAVTLVVSMIAALITALALASVQTIYAQSPTPAENMASANDLYNIERYQEAAQSYERLVGLGYEDQDLFYNLGNAYYKQDDLGRAISTTCAHSVWLPATRTYRSTSPSFEDRPPTLWNPPNSAARWHPSPGLCLSRRSTQLPPCCWSCGPSSQAQSPGG